jgi:pre-mRNA-processing factor 39
MDIDNLRQVYSQFLELFPLCYAYWKKFADWEKNRGDFHPGKVSFDEYNAPRSGGVDLYKKWRGKI